jgi:ABC-type glycerol-3-phosphate transport system substrate-binding protein
MMRLVLFLVLVAALATAAGVSATPATAHYVQTPVAWADPAPGDFAAVAETKLQS